MWASKHVDRDPKNIFYYQRDVENYTDQVLNFFYSIDINMYTRNLTVCNSGQHTYVTGLFNFFVILQDLIDRIDSYFQRIALQRNLLHIGFSHSTSQVFSDVNKQPSLEWRCVNWKVEIMTESGRSVSNIKISILLTKG